MISLAQIAKMIGVHRNTAIKYMRKGDFPSYNAYEKGGRGYLFRESYQLYADLLDIAVHVLHGGTLTTYPKLRPEIRVAPKGQGA